jgi:hypothetical protein
MEVLLTVKPQRPETKIKYGAKLGFPCSSGSVVREAQASRIGIRLTQTVPGPSLPSGSVTNSSKLLSANWVVASGFVKL